MVAVALRQGLASKNQENGNVVAHREITCWLVSLLSDCLPGQAHTNSKPGLTGALNGVQLYTTEQSGAVSRLYQKLTGGFLYFILPGPGPGTQLIPLIR